MHGKLQCPAEAVGPMQLMLIPAGEHTNTEPSRAQQRSPWVPPRCGQSNECMPHQHACKPSSAMDAV